jgi:hypothetical protein
MSLYAQENAEFLKSAYCVLLQEMGEAVKVVVRCRPMNTKERDMKCKVCGFQNIMEYYKKTHSFFFVNTEIVIKRSQVYDKVFSKKN